MYLFSDEVTCTVKHMKYETYQENTRAQLFKANDVVS